MKGERFMANEENTDAVAALSHFRATFYLLLSRAFSKELNRDALSGMDRILDDLMEVSDLMEIPQEEDIQTGASLLDDYFDQIRNGDDAKALRDLAMDYASLFLGIGQRTISPCESVYRSAAGLLFQTAQLEVRKAYEKIGMAKSDEFHEPDDHLALELTFMAELCKMTQEAIEKDTERAGYYLGLQRDFLEMHLLPWIPDFSEDLMDAARTPFYRAMAYLLRGGIRVDNQLIERMIGTLNVQLELKKKGGVKQGT
jgi:putative dimethyl sulfoxide reductase chaperone